MEQARKDDLGDQRCCSVVKADNASGSLVGGIQVAIAIKGKSIWIPRVDASVGINASRDAVRFASASIIEIGAPPDLVAVGDCKEKSALRCDSDVLDVWKVELINVQEHRT